MSSSSSSSPALEEHEVPEAKKPRLEKNAEHLPPEFSYRRMLLDTMSDQPISRIPTTLMLGGPTRNDLTQLRKLMDHHEFRTSVVASPRPALSIYKDSCAVIDSDNDNNREEGITEGKTFLITMLGLHPHQEQLEHLYSTGIKNMYCLLLFCQRLRLACPDAFQNKMGPVEQFVLELESECRAVGSNNGSTIHDSRRLSCSVHNRVASLIPLIVQAEPRNRAEQLQREYDQIVLCNSTLSNALVHLFSSAHSCTIKDIFFKRSNVTKYERFTIYLYDPDVDLIRPPQFIFLPSLKVALEEGPMAIVRNMIESFWHHLLRRGYFSSLTVKEALTPRLEKFFLSGITTDEAIPLQLNAHFNPTSALSFYLHGKAGTGKSSLARNIGPALESTIEEHMDPEILVRFVKQNLNKRFDILELEFELRPNNNDLSVMSIIQSRRMTMTQSKPGLVLVDMEEMPSNNPDSNPNQLQVAQLISQRFAGRNGGFHEGSTVPRNSEKRGLQNDASLMSLFTSNYELDPQSYKALLRLKLFENLLVVPMTAISGKDRQEFVNVYVQQCIKDRFPDQDIDCDVKIKIPSGEGDTRPLVRHLRMISFYLHTLVADSIRLGSRIDAVVVQKGGLCMVTANEKSMELQLGTLDNLLPLTQQVFDRRAQKAIENLRETGGPSTDFGELSIILDFWLAKTLAPAVVVSNDNIKIKRLTEAVGSLEGVHQISNVDAGEYKIMKSLYDPSNTPNLRDDILACGCGAFVAVELLCPTTDSQLCVREIIEDSPSMTAFSSSRSALYKSGLLFAVYVEGEITPEVRSRASFIF